MSARTFATTLCFLVALSLWSANASSAVYYVDQAHPKALDSNPGTEDQPFKTISAAVAKVKPGDTVYVKNGTYRESVNWKGAEGPKGTIPRTERMTLSAMPGQRPVIKGSELVTAKFEPVRVALRQKVEKLTRDAGYDPDAWRKAIGVDGPLKAQAAPVANPNEKLDHAKAEFVGIYACPWETYTSLVFADESRLGQIGLQGSPERAAGHNGFQYNKQWDGKDLSDLRPGSCYYDKDAKRLYVWLADGSDPNKHVIEAGVRGTAVSLLQGTWTVSGFDARQCQDCGSGGEAAVWIHGSGSMIENCRITQNGYIGGGVHGEDTVLRGCVFAYNGMSGILPSLNWRFLIEGNEFHHNNWIGGVLCGCDGEKLCGVKDTRVLRNWFHDEPMALWFDINCNHTLVAENRFENVDCGVYFEISRWGVIANNTFRNCGRAIWSYSSDVLIAHNVTDGCGEGITVSGYWRACCYRQSFFDEAAVAFEDCVMAVRNNLVVNNIIIDSTGSYLAATRDDAYGCANYSDYNAFVWTLPAFHGTSNHIKFMAGWDEYYARLAFWRMDRHYDEHSIISDSKLHDYLGDGKGYDTSLINDVVGDARFVNRPGGDYHLRPDSPLKGKGIAVPPVLNSVYIPAKGTEIVSRPWARTDMDAVPPPLRAMRADRYGGKGYRVQPLPRVHRLVDLDAQKPADPGLNEEWIRTGKYPDFRTDGPPEAVPNDFGAFWPDNRLADPSFDKPLAAADKPIGQEPPGKWFSPNGLHTAQGTACANILGPGYWVQAYQKVGVIKPGAQWQLAGDMSAKSNHDRFKATAEMGLFAGKDFKPVKTVVVTAEPGKALHWTTHELYYQAGADAKADPLVGQDLYVVIRAKVEGPAGVQTPEPVGFQRWDHFILLSSEPTPAERQ